MYDVILTKEYKKKAKKIFTSKETIIEVNKKLKSLANNPYKKNNNIKKLRKKKTDKRLNYSYKIGEKIRILYYIDNINNIVCFFNIFQREEGYKRNILLKNLKNN